jgi:amino acid permease
MGLLQTNSYFQQSAKLVLASVGALLIPVLQFFYPRLLRASHSQARENLVSAVAGIK